MPKQYRIRCASGDEPSVQSGYARRRVHGCYPQRAPVDAGVDAGVDDADDLGDAGAGAEHGCVCVSPFGGVGRPASRPGSPLQSRCARFPLRSLSPPLPSVAARSAYPAVRYAHRRCRTDTPAARFDGAGVFTAGSSSRRRYLPRSSVTSPRSPWPAAGNASARRASTPCVAGDGFAVHRRPHCPMQDRLISWLLECHLLQCRNHAESTLPES